MTYQFLVLLFTIIAVFAEEQRRLQILENAPVGTLVGRIRDDLPPSNSGPSYILVYPPESQVEQAFLINDQTGEIRTKIALDYETKASYVFLAISDKAGRSGDGIRVTVEVIDVNDCAPEFPQKRIDLQLSEYAKIGSEIPLPAATDKDGSERFGVQKYELISGNVNNAFRLGVRRLNRLLYADLIVNSELDRELLDHYVLEIRAIDGGEPPLTDTLRVNVTILDANDNTPIFDHPRYVARLASNSSVGMEVIRVHADDKDLGDNGVVDYRFLPSPLDAQKWFRIDGATGRITLAQSIQKFRQSKQYELFVAARDRGYPQPLESTAFVTVSVVDVDEHKPDIKIIYLSDDGRPVVSEAADVGSLLARVSVSDADSQISQKADVSIEGDDDTFGVKESSDAVYLFLKKRLDREMRQNYTLNIVAKFGDVSFRRSVVIRISDINDNAPVFKKTFYEAEIREKSTPGTSVTRVEAVDADEGENSVITYSFASSNAKYSNWLDIDPETGLITTADIIDCEISSKPEFTVVATDHGKPSLSSSVKLAITVLDVNDNPPLFTQPVYNVSVREDAEVGYCFLKVQATDPDCGVNAQIHYKLSSDTLSDAAYPFKADENSGNVCLSAKLDYETRRKFQFPVLAYDGGGLFGQTVVMLSVEDVNDNAPIFYPNIYNVTVRQNVAPGTWISIANAVDLDDGQFGVVTYAISSGNDAGKFHVDKQSGELFVDQSLSQTSYQLSIQAVDGGGLTAVHPALVNVVVVPDDYPSPQFEEKLYRFNIREDTLPGISVGTVQANAPSGSGVVYSIYSGDSMGNFSIDQHSGTISIVRYLDFEVQKLILLNVQASVDHPPAVNQTQVEVIVEDVNDNPPIFERKIVRLTIAEDYALQKWIFACYASDRDSGKNGEVRYRFISNPGNVFMIHPVTGEVRLTQKLDYERRKNYTLVVLAQDGGIPPLADNMTLEIDVLDVNDHDPHFAVPDYRAVVSEDAAPMTKIIQLQATDEDSGVNGQISFRLDYASTPGEVFPFRVFADSGWIYVRQSLDRETKAEYSFTAVAKDNGQPSRSSTIPVVIRVSDVNDHAPNCLTIQQLSISENRPAGTFVGRVKADDPDEGENGTVVYSLADVSHALHFRLTQNGELYTEVALDRESESVYDLTVIASDQGRPPLSSVCSVHVAVLDENDNAPFFVLPLRDRLHFREEQPKGSEVAQIRANDPDEGDNGAVRYRLDRSDSNAPFSIDANTGVLSSTEVLDYETGQRKFEVTVIAEDLGQPPRSSRKTFVVDIVDVDDGGGSTNETVVFEVSESAPIGYQIGAVDKKRQLTDAEVASLIDADVISYSYEIISGNSQSLFDVDRLTSTLFLVKQLDYETSSAHFLIINKISQAKNAPMSQSEIRVKVLVLDENDNSPTFYEDPVVFSVPENKAGFIAWHYNATDEDAGSFGRIEYKILEQFPNDTGLFDLDKTSGDLLLKREFDFERVNEYLLVVEATDQAPNISQRRSSRVTTRIYVTDVNDCDPKFASRDHAHLFVDDPVGVPFFYVTAVDEDWLENGRVTYRLVAGNDETQFQLNTTSGALMLSKPLKRETKDAKEYRLTIVAEDHGVPQRTATQTLVIQVLDVDDYALRFEQSIYTANVTENGPAGVVVVQLRAHSPTEGDVKELLYILPNGIADNKFRMNEKTGTLLTAGPLDREEISEYILTVYVRDSPNSARYDAATVVVSVEDVNDNSPIIGEATCRDQSIPENQPFDVFHTIIASDRDSGSNGKLNYAIVGGNVDGKFRINAATGEIACDALDRETTAAYNLTVQVRDGGSPSLSAQCTLPVLVLDVNDNTPHFEQASYSAQVAENAPTGTTILKIRAVDPDEGLNGKVMYSIANETMGLFDVGANSGEIVVLGKLDYEQTTSYSFLVKAYDQGPSESRWDTVRVTVQILDTNDNAPVFASVPFIANVSSNVATGQRIVKVVATDSDGPGPNSDISYSLSDTSDNRFVINPTTGVISAKQDLRLSSPSVEYLNVVATDHGEPPLSARSVVEIVVDASDETYRRSSIKFSRSSYKAEVVENSEQGVKVIDIVARSSLSSPLEYKLISGNENGAFSIDPTTGTILVADSTHLDFETTKTYQLIVEAKASSKVNGLDRQRNYVSVRIDLLDANDHAPQFLQQRYSAAVSEGKAKGSFVIQVSATDGDVGENAALTYSIVSGNVDSAFAVDNAGLVKTNAELDREIHDRYTLTVMAADAGSPPKSGTAVIDVSVMDINDNSPSFPFIRPVKISENMEIGSLVTTVTANDVDSFPPLVYSIASRNSTGYENFNLDRFSGRLVLAKGVDYEKDHEFYLEIQVTDSVYVTSTRQKIIIMDENDNSPVFNQPFYQAALPTGAAAGTSVVQVSATDLDSGANGQIRYSFVGAAMESTGFWINPQSGEICINRTLGNRSNLFPLVQLTVSAADGGRPPRSAVTTVQVQIGYVSEERVDFASKVYSFSIAEDAPVHTVVGRLTTTAGDSSKHLRFLMNSGNVNQTFGIDSDGNVILMKQLDRETLDSYNLDLSLQTKANAISNSSAKVIIQVEDVNDNWPIFDQNQYRISIRESLAPGTMIIKLNAIDRDAGANGTITYELLSGDPENALSIDSRTGALSLRRPLTAIAANELQLIIRASDGGSPPHASIAGVQIPVQRENTSAPMFLVQRYVGWVTENAPVGTMVIRVKAATAGRRSTANANFTYSIVGGNEDGQFQLDAVTGEVKTKASLDYEQKTFYRLTVVVSDLYGRWSNTSAQVLVRGVDEFAPEFTQTAPTFQTSYDASDGDILGAVYATDRDAGIDGKITYVLKDKTPLFRIHPQTAVLSVASSLAGLEEKSDAKKGEGDPTSPMKDVKSVFLTVVAFSGPDVITGKSNSTVVEIQIGHFAKSTKAKLAAAGTIISISVGLVLLLIFILVLVTVKLRRQENKPIPTRKAAMAKQNHKSRKNRQLLKPNDIVQPCQKAASRAAAGFNDGLSPTAPTPGGQVHPSGVTVCNVSTKSSGRGSLVDENDGGKSSIMSNSDRRHRSALDSGINMYADDDDSVSSSDLPNTREYLTSLGVEARTSCRKGHPRILVSGEANEIYGEPLRPSQRLDDDLADVQDLIYSKVNEVLADEGDIADLSASKSIDYYSIAGATSNDVLAPRASWSTPLPNCGPSYQPLTQVFSEIVKIKSDQDTLRRRVNKASNGDAPLETPPPVPRHDRIPLPDSLRVDPSGVRNRVGSTDRSPNSWAPTNFASPDEPSYAGAYAVGGTGHSPSVQLAKSPYHSKSEHGSEADLEIKI